MNLIVKNRLIFWVLIILVVINISALTSFFLFTKSPAPAACCPPEEQQCMAFRDELKLTDAQTVQVNAINKVYAASAGPAAAEIKATRAAILTEMENEVPDTLKLNVLTDQLALLQMKIQKENIKQYSELKRVCTPEQVQRLSGLYRDLYGCPMQNGQKKHRNRHGQDSKNMAPCK